MRWLGGALAATVAVVAGCNYPGPSLQGQPGLQYEVISFYNDRAMERSASCPNPEIRSITNSRIVEDGSERVVMDIRYYWIDWSQAVDLGGASLTTCRDWGERTFTFSRSADGRLQVDSMTGPQKQA